MNTRETYQNVIRIRSEVYRLGLDGMLEVSRLPIDTLASAYNGTGPEFLPKAVREKLDSVCEPFLPAVMVHDVDFTRSDGSLDSFEEANLRLLANCMICALDAAPWYRIRRYALVLEALAIYRACSKFGWTAWLSACRKHENAEKE